MVGGKMDARYDGMAVCTEIVRGTVCRESRGFVYPQLGRTSRQRPVRGRSL